MRIGLDAPLVAACKRWQERTLGHALARAAAFVGADERPILTRVPWASGILLPPIRFGGPFRGLLPDESSAMPIDGAYWQVARDDLATGDALRDLTRLIQALRADGDPLIPAVVVALDQLAAPTLPPDWDEPPFPVARLFVREAAALAWRGLLRADAEDPLAVVLAEAVTARLAPPPLLPPPLLEGMQREERGWKDRATPPARAVETWSEGWIAQLPDDLLEQGWHEGLVEEAQIAALRGLAKLDKALEVDDPLPLWATVDDGPGPVLMRLLENVDRTAHGEILRRQKGESGRFKGKHRRQLGAQHWARVAVAAAFDHWLKGLLDEARTLIEPEVLPEAQLREEAARGALYGCLAAEGPLPIPSVAPDAAPAAEGDLAPAGEGASSVAPTALSASTEAPVASTGYLFADLKGFTSLTASLREVETRQFLRSGFYEPLLRLAKEYFKGGTDLADRGGIRINNLMGDALSVCGEPIELLEFAERATALCRDEARDLLARRRASDAFRAAEARRGALEAEAGQLRQQAAKGAIDAAGRARLGELNEELSQLEVAGADGPELDFGFYVSFGPPPVELTIEDDVFGKLFVAMAEKINESARGVERNGAVGAAVEAARQALGGGPAAFRVHVGPVIAGRMPAPLFEAWPTTPEDVDAVAQTLRSMVSFEGGTAMYNGSIALSSETAARITPPQVTVWRGKREALADVLPGRVILEPRQHLVLVPGRDGGARLLRFCGRVQMKGYPQPQPVWEWLGPFLEGFERLVAFVESDGKRAPAVQALQA